MRIVRGAGELTQAFKNAQAEAQAAFGVPDIYLEKFVDAPRHVEIQVMADTKGNIVHLGERECSIQRRHQKILEEAPSVIVNDRLRRRMGRTAVEAAAAVQYVSAGTLEFLVDKDLNYYFMEMNTRIQVEHGGEPLSFAQKDVLMSGHAIECRVNAEDPFTFVPSPGVIRHFHVPGGPGVRVDTFAHEGCEITPHYDSLVAKVMTHGRDRREAIARMKRCLDLTVVEGIKTNIPLHKRILDEPDFVAGRIDTRFMERYQTARKASPGAP
jgi:acetyl-CoA carboxylase biotin carboxylase subunit